MELRLAQLFDRDTLDSYYLPAFRIRDAMTARMKLQLEPMLVFDHVTCWSCGTLSPCYTDYPGSSRHGMLQGGLAITHRRAS